MQARLQIPMHVQPAVICRGKTQIIETCANSEACWRFFTEKKQKKRRSNWETFSEQSG